MTFSILEIGHLEVFFVPFILSSFMGYTWPLYGILWQYQQSGNLIKVTIRSNQEALFSRYLTQNKCVSSKFDYRMLSIFYNTRMSNDWFRTICKVFVAIAWCSAILPMVPSAFGAFGKYGLECKTRKCTLINLQPDGNPTSLNAKQELGRWSVVVAGILLLIFNFSAVIRLRV